MLTGMTERDWLTVLEVFDAAQSSRGEPGHDDRKFLEAIHYFTVHSITWRALPREYGKWNSVWKRFWRLSRSGVFEAFFQMLAECSQTAHLIQFFDSTTARAHVSAPGQKRLSWLASVVSLFYGPTCLATLQDWRDAPPPSAASALPRREACQL